MDDLVIGVIAVLLIAVMTYVIKPTLFISAKLPAAGVVPPSSSAAGASAGSSSSPAAESSPAKLSAEGGVPPAGSSAGASSASPVVPPTVSIAVMPSEHGAEPPANITPVSIPTVPAATIAGPYTNSSPNTTVVVPVAVDVVSRRAVKTITISKDMSGIANDGMDTNTFQMGEVKVYDMAGNKLPAATFSSVAYGPNNGELSYKYPASYLIDDNINSYIHTKGGPIIHSISLTLANPTVLSKVEVYNRVSCCQTRLAGATLTLKDSAGSVVESKVLTADLIQTLLVSK